MPIPLVSILEFTIIFRMAMVPVRQRSLLRGEVNLPKAAQRRAQNFKNDQWDNLPPTESVWHLPKWTTSWQKRGIEQPSYPSFTVSLFLNSQKIRIANDWSNFSFFFFQFYFELDWNTNCAKQLTYIKAAIAFTFIRMNGRARPGFRNENTQTRASKINIGFFERAKSFQTRTFSQTIHYWKGIQSIVQIPDTGWNKKYVTEKKTAFFL